MLRPRSQDSVNKSQINDIEMKYNTSFYILANIEKLNQRIIMLTTVTAGSFDKLQILANLKMLYFSLIGLCNYIFPLVDKTSGDMEKIKIIKSNLAYFKKEINKYELDQVMNEYSSPSIDLMEIASRIQEQLIYLREATGGGTKIEANENISSDEEFILYRAASIMKQREEEQDGRVNE